MLLPACLPCWPAEPISLQSARWAACLLPAWTSHLALPARAAEEDELLKQLVAEHGTKRWAHIASIMGTKGSKQVGQAQGGRRWHGWGSRQGVGWAWPADQ